jgi:hemoglobin-like flavoprotein
MCNLDERPTHKALFVKSLNRCIEKEGFIPSFYRRFLASSEEVRFKFRDTDFEAQYKRLEDSLFLVAAATYGQTEGLQHLRERATTHSRQHLNIKPEFYELWRSAILATAREYDREWDEEVEAAFESILGFAIEYMIKRY